MQRVQDVSAPAILAVAANVGGMASLIGTPPNAIVVGALNDLTPAVQVDFLSWILMAGPVAIIVAVIARLLIPRFYRTALQRIDLPPVVQHDGPGTPPWQRLVMGLVLFLTVLSLNFVGDQLLKRYDVREAGL